jgi:outer membrane protein assembly factor BamB
VASRCPECGTPRVRGAGWCGGCGRALEPAPGDDGPSATRARPGARTRRRPPLPALAALLVVSVVVAIGVRPSQPGEGEVVVPEDVLPRTPVDSAPAAGDVPGGVLPCVQSDAPCTTGTLRPQDVVDARVRSDGTVLLLHDAGRTVSWVSRSGSTLRATRTTDVRAAPLDPPYPFGTRDVDETVDDVRAIGFATGPTVASPGDVEVPPPSARPPVLLRTAAGGLLGFPPDLRATGWYLPPPDHKRLEVLAVVDGLALVSAEVGTLRAVSVADGSTRWLASRPGSNDAPVRLVTVTSRVAVLDGGTGLLALDLTDGSEAWRVDPAGGRLVAAGAAGDLVLTLDTEVTLTARRAATGEEVWAVPLATTLAAAVDLTGDGTTVVVRLDPPAGRTFPQRNVRVLGVDPDDGDVRWVHLYATDLPTWPLTIVDGLALQQGTDAPAAVSALDLRRGQLAWSATPGEERGQLLELGRGLVALVEEDVVRIVVAATGRRTATFELGDGRVLAAGAGIVVVARDGQVDLVAV